MLQPWFDSYPQGIAHEIDDPGDRTLVDLFETRCREFADRTAFISMGAELSYAQLDSESRHFAAFLQHDLGFEKGDRIALMMPNLLQYPIALFGILRAGMVVVNVNPLYTARELQHQLTDARIRGIVIVENFAATLQAVRDKGALEAIITTQIGDGLPGPKRLLTNLAVKYIKRMVPSFRLPGAIGFNAALARGAGHAMQPVTIHADDVAFLQYTGGTTGPAKGAKLLHRNLVANIAQASAWLQNHLTRGEERIITALPLYHVFALTANCFIFFDYGGTNILVANPRDIPGLVKTFDRHAPTAFTGVNTLFNALVNNEAFQAVDFSALKLTLGGGAAVQRAVAEKWKQTTGVTLVEAYGLTETSPAALINPMDLAAYNGAIGLPIPSTQVVIRDDDGRDMPQGESGELCIRGPQVMPGYWNNPDADADSFFDDGFFRSGDIATMDERGFFYIVDRKKDMILVSGFNVFPNEIEDVVADHPGVIEGACIGIPDEHSGEAIKLFVVRRDDSVTREAIIEHCRNKLTAYKVPRQVEFVDALPKSNVGKILRRDLRARQD